jgi:hypothetical protein
MKCFSSLLLCLPFFLSNVAALALMVQSSPQVGTPTEVSWSKQPSDPAELKFDLRLVRDGLTDVGLAAANIFADAKDVYGQLDVVFPKAGKYNLVAVTGPHYFNIGRSNQVEAVAPTSTTSCTVSPTGPVSQLPNNPSSPPQQPVSAAKTEVNLPVVVGVIVGVILLIGFLVALFIVLRRRRDSQLDDSNRRISFYKDLMVQARTPSPDIEGGIIIPYPFVTSPSIQPPPPAVRPLPKPVEDKEPKYPVSPPLSEPTGGLRRMPTAHLGTGHIVPPPRGPRDRGPSRGLSRSSNARRTDDSTPEPPSSEESITLTARQQGLLDRMAQIRGQMAELQRHPHPGPNTQIVLSNMQRQLNWLAETQESPWALGDTDVRPPEYTRHMTP